MWPIRPKHTFESVLCDLKRGLADGSVVVSHTPTFDTTIALYSMEDFLEQNPHKAEKWKARIRAAETSRTERLSYDELLRHVGI